MAAVGPVGRAAGARPTFMGAAVFVSLAVSLVLLVSPLIRLTDSKRTENALFTQALSVESRR
jgi:hypothetical protein